jgi:hypothetical protein
LWFDVYRAAGHIKTQISLDEYTQLFEHIWKDRAMYAGWAVRFKYDGADTVLTFIKNEDNLK